MKTLSMAKKNAKNKNNLAISDKPKRNWSLLINHILTLMSLFFALISLILFWQQNILVKESWKLQQDTLGFDIDIRSQDYISQAYDDLYADKKTMATLDNIKENKYISETSEILKIVDIFEETGSNFCQGTAKARHIKIYLLKTLSTICNNSQIYEVYAGKKNGTAILCYEFFPESKFAETLNRDQIETCEFIDSSRFEETDNKRRFELK